MIFRVRSARRVYLPDVVLFRRLLAIVLAYVVYLVVWALTQPPQVEHAITLAGLKYKRCTVTWNNGVIILGQTHVPLVSCAGAWEPRPRDGAQRLAAGASGRLRRRLMHVPRAGLILA